MNKRLAFRMLDEAREYVGDDVLTPYEFEDVELDLFLHTYLSVMYVAGFRNAVVQRHIRELEAAFHDLDLDAIVAMRSIDASALPIRNQRKADAFLRGCRLIHEEGWSRFKRRLSEGGRRVLRELPWMGPVTSQHMVLLLGLEDTEKCDTWLKQCAEACSTSVCELVTYLSQEFGLTRQQVDYYLWKYCSDHQSIPLPD